MDTRGANSIKLSLASIATIVIVIGQSQRPASASLARRPHQNQTKTSRHLEDEWASPYRLLDKVARYRWPMQGGARGHETLARPSRFDLDGEPDSAHRYSILDEEGALLAARLLQHGQRRHPPVEQRFDDDEGDHMKHHHDEGMEEHHKEGKEISLIYPLLLALLILGALFVPFISLFFFLAVSAFNCHSGFSQVSPVFGRRRRRRRKRSLVETSDGGPLAHSIGVADAAASGASRALIATFAQALLEDFEEHFLARERRQDDEQDDEWNLITTKLPLSMLFDALEFVEGGTRARNDTAPPPPHPAGASKGRSSGGITDRSAHDPSEPAAQHKPIAAANLGFGPAGHAAHNSSGAWNDYKLWQQQLAKSTVLLRNALVKFIDF